MRGGSILSGRSRVTRPARVLPASHRARLNRAATAIAAGGIEQRTSPAARRPSSRLRRTAPIALASLLLLAALPAPRAADAEAVAPAGEVAYATLSVPAWADTAETMQRAIASQVLVVWEPGTGPEDRAAVLAGLGASEALTELIDLVEVDGEVDDVLRRLDASAAVRAAEPNRVVTHAASGPGITSHQLDDATPPNDLLAPQQWGHHNSGQVVTGQNTQGVPVSFSGAPGVDARVFEAWAVTRGDPALLVAVIDTRIDLTHPDVAGAVVGTPILTIKDAETANPAHGTAVASIVAARADDFFGIAGVAPQVSLLSIASFKTGADGKDSATLDSVVRGIDEAVKAGAHVINASWTTDDDRDGVLREAVAAAGIPVVAASGNNGKTWTENSSASDLVFPAALDLPNLVTVTAIDAQGGVPSFANLGPDLVDLGAPGHLIMAANDAGGHSFSNGTSVAAPYVTGALALAMSAAPYATLGDLTDTLAWTSRPLSSLDGVTRTGGMLDVAALVRGVQRPVCRPDLLQPSSFPDVGPDHVHRQGVDCVVGQGIATGLGAGLFGPAQHVTRAQVAAFLARIVERSWLELPPAPDAGFVDIPASYAHRPAIDRLADLGIVRGVGDGRFDPNAPVTRGQLASFLVRMHAHLTQIEDATPSRLWFADVVGTTHQDAIHRARDLGLVRGVGPAAYDPAAFTRRDQMASLLARVVDALAREGIELSTVPPAPPANGEDAPPADDAPPS